MKITLEWQKPIALNISDGQLDLDYDSVPAKSGLYVFGRKHGRSFGALYVGQASNLKSRIKTQLNNAKLVNHIKVSANGKRLLVVGVFKSKQGQTWKKCSNISEKAIIRHFLSLEHDLVNNHGTKIKYNEIVATGKLPKKMIPKIVSVEAT